MRFVLFILFLISASNAEHTVSVRCSNSSENTVTFQPTEDNVEGRYKVEWCLEAINDITVWSLVMRYTESLKPSKCRNFTYKFVPGPTHSRFDLPVTIDLNCSQVCLSTSLDLVFNDTCYHINTSLQKKPSGTIRSDSLHYVINNFTKEHFTNSIPVVSPPIYEAGMVIISWYLGFVPATDISLIIMDDKKKEYNVSYSVSGELQSEVTCWAVLPPGCYKAILVHQAPWAGTVPFQRITNIEHEFCQAMPGEANASSSPEGAWRAMVGVLVAVVVVALVLFAVWRHRPASWQRRVRDHWLKTVRSQATQPPKVDGVILLLYARDCAPFVRAAERLAALVQNATGCRVIDVYSGKSTRLWAPAGDEWLRLVMSREDTRVLLLQSPAGALLAADLADTRAGPALAAPLLGSRVMWRRPHAGDALLSLALRLLSAAPPPAPYRKHYVAGISGLGAEMAAGVTPQRRYTLPEAAACLLRDLAPGLNLAPGQDLAPGLNSTPGLDQERIRLEPLLQQFKEAAEAFTSHVRDHPDYLADELLFN